MKKLFIPVLSFCTFLLLMIPSLWAENKDKPFIGEWVYEVSDAPIGYEKGSLVFSEANGQAVLVIRLEAGELTPSNLKIEKDSITFTVTVEGNPVNVVLHREKNTMNGTVDSPEGRQTITALKKD